MTDRTDDFDTGDFTAGDFNAGDFDADSHGPGSADFDAGVPRPSGGYGDPGLDEPVEAAGDVPSPGDRVTGPDATDVPAPGAPTDAALHAELERYVGTPADAEPPAEDGLVDLDAELAAIFAADDAGEPAPSSIQPPAAPLSADAAAFSAITTAPPAEPAPAADPGPAPAGDNDPPEEPKQARRRRKSRKDDPAEAPDAPLPSAGTLTPPRTAFDFLDGAYARARRARLLALVAVGACLAVVIMLAGVGARAFVDTEQINADVEAAGERNVERLTRLGTLTTFGGVTQSDLEAQLDKRARSMFLITDKTADYGAILARVAQLDAIPGVDTTSVSITDNTTFGGAAPAGATTTTAPADDEADEPAGEAPAAPAGSSWTVTVNATADTYATLNSWLSSVNALGWGATTEFSGGEGALTMSFTGTVTQTETQRQIDLANRLGVTRTEVLGEIPQAAVATPNEEGS